MKKIIIILFLFVISFTSVLFSMDSTKVEKKYPEATREELQEIFASKSALMDSISFTDTKGTKRTLKAYTIYEQLFLEEEATKIESIFNNQCREMREKRDIQYWPQICFGPVLYAEPVIYNSSDPIYPFILAFWGAKDCNPCNLDDMLERIYIKLKWEDLYEVQEPQNCFINTSIQ